MRDNRQGRYVFALCGCALLRHSDGSRRWARTGVSQGQGAKWGGPERLGRKDNTRIGDEPGYSAMGVAWTVPVTAAKPDKAAGTSLALHLERYGFQ